MMTDIGVGKGGQGGHVPLRNCHAEIFFFKQHGICDSQSNVQHTFGVSWGFVPDMGSVPVWIPTVPLVTEPSFVPFETNSQLRP